MKVADLEQEAKEQFTKEQREYAIANLKAYLEDVELCKRKLKEAEERYIDFLGRDVGNLHLEQKFQGRVIMR